MRDEVPGHIAQLYQSIGEFVVTFQWVENKYREIGWLILDPNRESWPPRALRKETNSQLIDKVTDMFVRLLKTHDLPGAEGRAEDFSELASYFHDLRAYRNRFIHSTFIELKAGGELVGYVRSNPQVGVDPDTGDLIYDQEHVSAEIVRNKILESAPYALRLGNHYIQWINWAPFGRSDEE